MTITFPRSFPAGLDAWGACDFNLMRQQVANTTYGGQFTGMELADAFWTCKYSTILLGIDGKDRAVWQAWERSLKGVFNAFYGYDPEKRYPFFYGASVLNLTRYGGGAFDGTATVVSTTASTISVSALPASYQFSVGDYISIPMTVGQRSLYQILEAVTASGTGTATVSVEPSVRSGAATTALGVQLVSPTCVMIIKPGTFSAQAQAASAQAVTFEAVQKLV
jgi:hypothetical protein